MNNEIVECSKVIRKIFIKARKKHRNRIAPPTWITVSANELRNKKIELKITTKYTKIQQN